MNTKKNEDIVVVILDEARELLNDDEPNGILFLTVQRSLASIYKRPFVDICISGVFMDTSSKTADISPFIAYDPSAGVFRGSNLCDLYMFSGMKDVRKDVNCRLTCSQD
jgi:hypothetical protein